MSRLLHDGDGIPTSSEDKDGDGDASNDELDGNGIPDYLEEAEPVDSDGDGVSDGDECSEVSACADTDKDGTPDNKDDDDDGDGMTTEQELLQAAVYGADVDKDGVPDYLQVYAAGAGLDGGCDCSVKAGLAA